MISRVSFIDSRYSTEEDHSGVESLMQGPSAETTLDASYIVFLHLLFLTLESYTFLYLY